MTWLGRLLRRGRLEAELDLELRDHVERQTAEYVRQGLNEREARRLASLAFGGIEQTKEHCREARGTRWLHDVVQDVRYAARLLARAPAFTLVVVGSLALGIGANTAIFSLLDSLLLRSLPVRAPQQLAVLAGGDWTNPIWEQIRQRQSQLFDGALAWSDDRMNLASSGEVEPVDGMWVSGEFFDVLGVPALLGRTIIPSDDRRGGGPDGPVAVISHRFWQQRFGGATDAIGRTLTLNRVPFTIVGVTPPGFAGPTVGRAFDVALPIGDVDLLRDGPESQLDGRSTWWLQVMVRMRPGQTIDQAAQALNGVRPQIRTATMPSNSPADAAVRYLQESLTLVPAANGLSALRRTYQRPLQLLMGVVLLVLLITCANVANLLLARADARRHEMSARLALGASRWRLGRQLLTESLLIAALGALLGLVLAQWASPLLVYQLSTPERPVSLDVSLNWRLLAFNAAVASATALIFGIAPVIRATRIAPHEVLADHGRSHTGDSRHSLSGALVVAQIALSLVLVVAAALFVRTFSTLTRLDPGFDADRVLLVTVDTSAAKDPLERRALYQRALDAARTVPGVVHAGASVVPPMSGMGWNDRFDFPGRPRTSARDGVVWVNAVTPGFFAAYGTSQRAGRDFDERDRAGAANVVIVNEAFVRKYLAGNPIGQAVHRAGFPGHPALDATIVGVVADAAYRSLREPLPPIVYTPFWQLPEAESSAGLAVRVADGSPLRIRRSLAAALQQVDPRLALTFRPLSEQVDAALSRERLIAVLSAFFGGLALLVAAVGLYGVTSYAVARRRGEIGIRMALGADPAHVIRLLVGRAALLVAGGVAIGGVLSLWASHLVAGLLFGLQPRDPATFAGAVLVLAAVGALAAWIPARRGSRIDPARVLREG